VQIGHIGSIEVVYPDQPEQAQILTTLDRETARIDALVEKKTRFIELLKEKRQALITQARG
jgi:type I restriction enzyme S subunit